MRRLVWCWAPEIGNHPRFHLRVFKLERIKNRSAHARMCKNEEQVAVAGCCTMWASLEWWRSGSGWHTSGRSRCFRRTASASNCYNISATIWDFIARFGLKLGETSQITIFDWGDFKTKRHKFFATCSWRLSLIEASGFVFEKFVSVPWEGDARS